MPRGAGNESLPTRGNNDQIERSQNEIHACLKEGFWPMGDILIFWGRPPPEEMDHTVVSKNHGTVH